jgi:hypothetical protein
VLADTLNQISINGQGRFGQADPNMIATLRGIAIGLQPGQSAEVRKAAVEQLQEILARPHTANQVAQAMQDVQQIKMANIKELARVLQNEAGSYPDQPIMETVGHTVLNRMRRNETAVVKDVSGQYTLGQKPPELETHNLAIRLLNGELPDNTGGATHFYQPSEMKHPTPVPTDAKGNYLTDKPPPGYEYVPGVTMKDALHNDVPAFSVRPTWADGLRRAGAQDLPEALIKLFIAPGSGHVR